MDIGKLDARYLRDVELAHLLSAMVAKGLVVTVVLDSCHSGGATRGTDEAGVAPRGAERLGHALVSAPPGRVGHQREGSQVARAGRTRPAEKAVCISYTRCG